MLAAVCLVSLTRSCLKAFDCTHDNGRGVSTLDAMPDVVCHGPIFMAQKRAAIGLLCLYCAILPVRLWIHLFIATDKGQLQAPHMLQSFGW